MSRLLVAVENVATLDGRVLSHTRLPHMVHVLAPARLPGSENRLIVVGRLTHWERHRAVEFYSCVLDEPAYLISAQAGFAWRRWVGWAPAVGVGDAATLVNPDGLTMVRGGRIASVVLVEAAFAPWLGMEIR